MSEDGRILVGVIGAPHGVRGELRLKSYTGDPAAIATYRPLQSPDGRRSFEITSFRLLKDDMAVVRLKGVEDRTAAEALTNLQLYVERDRLPPPDEDEFYHADLIGLRAETEAGVVLGHVVGLPNYGAGDLIEIAPPRGETVLVPFTKAFVPVVDLGAGRVVVADVALAESDGDTDASDGQADG